MDLRTGMRRLQRGVLLAAITGFLAPAVLAQPGASELRRPGPPVARAPPQAAGVVSAQSRERLHLVEPRTGAQIPPGEFRLRVLPPDAGGRQAEVLLAWNSDPRGVTPIEICRVPLDQLVSGILVPPQATRGRLGSFTLQARVVAPYQGPWSAPVDVRLGTREPSEVRGPLPTPSRETAIRQLPRQVAEFTCSG